MVLRKTSDQYLDIDFQKNFNKKLKHKISKSVTLTSRSPRVGHDGTA